MPKPPTWQELHDPDDIARERAIRRDQRRLDFRELEATAKDLRWTLEELQKPDLKEQRRVDLMDRLYRLVNRLIVAAERKADAA